MNNSVKFITTSLTCVIWMLPIYIQAAIANEGPDVNAELTHYRAIVKSEGAEVYSETDPFAEIIVTLPGDTALNVYTTQEKDWVSTSIQGERAFIYSDQLLIKCTPEGQVRSEVILLECNDNVFQERIMELKGVGLANEAKESKKKEKQEEKEHSSDSSLSKKVEPKLLSCEKHMQENRLTTGEGGNAYNCYNEILAVDPGNRIALAGIKQIEDKYSAWAKKYINNGNKTKAKDNITKLEKINPDNQDLKELQKLFETKTKRDVPTEPNNLLAGVYRDNGDGTVTDVRNNLQWQRCAQGQRWTGNSCVGDASLYSYKKAVESALRVGKGWRMPTKSELLTLVYCSSGRPAKWASSGKGCEGIYRKPAIVNVAFPNIAKQTFFKGPFYWSATRSGSNKGKVWGVQFTYGTSMKWSAGGLGRGRVRLVRNTN